MLVKDMECLPGRQHADCGRCYWPNRARHLHVRRLLRADSAVLVPCAAGWASSPAGSRLGAQGMGRCWWKT